jgi:hypothetical protein
MLSKPLTFTRERKPTGGKISNEKPVASEISWEEATQLPATAATLEMLMEGEIAALCVPSFLDVEDCRALKQRAEELEFKDYLNVTPRIGRVGITVFEYESIGKRQYFEAVNGANRSIAAITAGICDPLQRMIGWLSALSPNRKVGLAREENHGPYFAGLLRRIEEGTMIHVDFAPLEQPAWAVARIQKQLAFNIYLDVPQTDPGVVDLWRKQWQPEDQKHKIPGSYGYREQVVAGTPQATVAPKTGMMMMINTQNYHRVSPAGGSRLAFSAAVGRMPDRSIVLWS